MISFFQTSEEAKLLRLDLELRDKYGSLLTHLLKLKMKA